MAGAGVKVQKVKRTEKKMRKNDLIGDGDKGHKERLSTT